MFFLIASALLWFVEWRAGGAFVFRILNLKEPTLHSADWIGHSALLDIAWRARSPPPLHSLERISQKTFGAVKGKTDTLGSTFILDRGVIPRSILSGSGGYPLIFSN